MPIQEAQLKAAMYCRLSLFHKVALVLYSVIETPRTHWSGKGAKDVDEAKELVKTGFDYVTDIEGMKLFRKRK